MAEELYFIYEDAEKKERDMLDIFEEEEKRKRGLFWYQRLLKSNPEPARSSMSNVKVFLEGIQEALKKKRII